MILWMSLLRALGTMMLLGVVVDFINFAQTEFFTEFRFLSGQLIHNAEQLCIVVVCFGVAAGLGTVQRTDDRLRQAMTRRRRTVQPPYPPPPEAAIYPVPTQNLAPEAPEWDDVRKPLVLSGAVEQRLARRRRTGSVSDLYDDFYNDRLARDQYGAEPQPSSVREAPAPVRRTPGTDDQYAADTLPMGAYRPVAPDRPPMPRSLPGLGLERQRQLLREGRDKQIRRAQAEQSRKQKPHR